MHVERWIPKQKTHEALGKQKIYTPDTKISTQVTRQ
jgi:hypothetical protein